MLNDSHVSAEQPYDFVFLTEFGYDANYFSNGDYDKETFKLNDFPFVFHTVGAARKLLADGGINILHLRPDVPELEAARAGGSVSAVSARTGTP